MCRAPKLALVRSQAIRIYEQPEGGGCGIEYGILQVLSDAVFKRRAAGLAMRTRRVSLMSFAPTAIPHLPGRISGIRSVNSQSTFSACRQVHDSRFAHSSDRSGTSTQSKGSPPAPSSVRMRSSPALLTVPPVLLASSRQMERRTTFRFQVQLTETLLHQPKFKLEVRTSRACASEMKNAFRD